MTAILLAFPRSRDVAFIRRHVEHLRTRRSSEVAERYLHAQLRIQAETMARRGIASGQIDREIAALEAAIRHELDRYRVQPGGAA
jgi:hypothetical protein